MRNLLIVFAAVGVIVGFIVSRAPRSAGRDRFQVAEERLEAARARGQLDKGEVESLRYALRIVRDDAAGNGYTILRGAALRNAAAERTPCHIADLSPWLDEPVGVAECRFSPR